MDFSIPLGDYVHFVRTLQVMRDGGYSGFTLARAIDTFSELKFSQMKQCSGVKYSFRDLALTISAFIVSIRFLGSSLNDE